MRIKNIRVPKSTKLVVSHRTTVGVLRWARVTQSQFRVTMVPTLAVRSVDGRVGVRISHRTLSVAYRSWIRRRILRVLKRGGVVGVSYPAQKV